ncbi:hypothetical protein cypCar_00047160 [Cyprinus carpio]|nr:hypothetical protein cypCar_00047160 [Cyprinus carpio]
MLLSLTGLIGSLICGCFANVITQVQTEVYKKEGENVTLSCNYSSAYTLQWYLQYPGSAPEFLLIILSSTGKVSRKSEIVERDPRFLGKVNEEKTHVILEISSTKLTDAALYYCALTPTVTGNTRTLCKNPPNSDTIDDCIFADSIEPKEKDDIIRRERESVTMSCTYDSSSSTVMLYWYRQYLNREPQFILHKGTGSWNSIEDIPDRRFRVTTAQSSTELTITSATLSDSALYYCALRVGAQ